MTTLDPEVYWDPFVFDDGLPKPPFPRGLIDICRIEIHGTCIQIDCHDPSTNTLWEYRWGGLQPGTFLIYFDVDRNIARIARSNETMYFHIGQEV